MSLLKIDFVSSKLSNFFLCEIFASSAPRILFRVFLQSVYHYFFYQRKDAKVAKARREELLC